LLLFERNCYQSTYAKHIVMQSFWILIHLKQIKKLKKGKFERYLNNLGMLDLIKLFRFISV